MTGKADSHMPCDDRKAALRAEMRSERDSVPADERVREDEAICARVCSLPAFSGADAVFTYLSFGPEVQTRGIIEAAWREGKVVALPRCTGPRQMRWFRISSFDGLEKSPFGVEEPLIDTAAEIEPGEFKNPVAIVPGLAFDGDGCRLGYGGGYYDAFLASFPGVSVGLCRESQRVDSLARLGTLDTHDRAVDIVVHDGK